ncbi:CorA family divalent cation transporter [Campylobacter blaseri]|nr:CorA family divalent cation transporter [Campylobacter blaseri]
MNFIFISELKWHYGYLFAIIFMILLAIIPLVIFKKKDSFN